MATSNTTSADRQGIAAIMLAVGATAVAVFVAVHLGGCSMAAAGPSAWEAHEVAPEMPFDEPDELSSRFMDFGFGPEEGPDASAGLNGSLA